MDAAGDVVSTATTGGRRRYARTDPGAGEYTVIASGYPPVAGGLTISRDAVDGHDIKLAHPYD